MKLLDGGTMFILCVLFVGFIFAENADAGEWYGSVGIGAATHENHGSKFYSIKDDIRTLARSDPDSTDIQDHAIVDIGYRWQWTNEISIKAFYFHISDPTRSNDGQDGVFVSLEFTL